MAIKILSTKDVHTNGIKMVIYGASGAGKTVLGSTAPDPIYVSAEKGLLSLADKDIPYIEVKSLSSFDEAYKYCVKSDHQTIVVDSISEVTQTVLDQTRKQMILDSNSGKIDARQAYGKIAESIGNMIRNFRDIDGKNVVFIAKERKVEDEDAGTTNFEAYLPGKVLPFDIPYLVDEFLSLQIAKSGERMIQTFSDRKRICKDRSGTLDQYEKADLTAIFEKIKAGKK